MRITVPGDPVAKGRPRRSRYGAYTPERTRIHEDAVRWILKAACEEPIVGAVKLGLTFTLSIPKSWSRKKREAAIINPWHTGKPDLDNLVKLLLDAANGVLWDDDAQVAVLSAQKLYGTEARTDVHVESIAP